MEKIINGKVYDTATAREVAYGYSTYPRGDLHFWEETLYLKKTGEFFLHGEGGPMTKYAVATGDNSWSGGQKIIPLTYQAAKEWAEKHLDGNDYEAIFGEVVEDESRRAVSLSLSVTAAETLARRASAEGITQSALVERLILE